MALSLGGERAFKALTAPRWRVFAHRAKQPEPAVLRAVIEVVDRVNDVWWTLPERDVVPLNVLERFDGHVRKMTPVLETCAD